MPTTAMNGGVVYHGRRSLRFCTGCFSFKGCPSDHEDRLQSPDRKRAPLTVRHRRGTVNAPDARQSAASNGIAWSSDFAMRLHGKVAAAKNGLHCARVLHTT